MVASFILCTVTVGFAGLTLTEHEQQITNAATFAVKMYPSALDQI